MQIGRILHDAWRLAKAESALLIPVAGLFVFLPQLAQWLLLPPLPTRPVPANPDQANSLNAMIDWFNLVYAPWAQANGVWIMLVALVSLFGAGAMLALFVGRDRPDVGAALARSGVLLPRLLLLALLIQVPTMLGLYFLILPGVYLLGRLMLGYPAIFATQRLSAVGAVSLSWRLTRGHSLQTAVLAGLPYLGTVMLMMPFQALADLMTSAHAVNPVAMAILGMIEALIGTIQTIGLVLIQVAIWRRLR